MELLCKPWQKAHPIYFYYTNKHGEKLHTLLVSLRFLKVSIGLKGSYLAKYYRLSKILQSLKKYSERKNNENVQKRM